MPQSVSPGSFTMLFSQELLKSMMMQSMSSVLGGGVQASLQLTPMALMTPVTAQVDSVVRNSIGSMDSQLASVGISLSGLGLGGGSTFTSATNGPIPRPNIPAGQTALTAGRLPGQAAAPGTPPGAPGVLGSLPGQSLLGLGATSTTASLLNPPGTSSLLGTPPPSPLTATPTVIRAADVGSTFSAVI